MQPSEIRWALSEIKKRAKQTKNPKELKTLKRSYEALDRQLAYMDGRYQVENESPASGETPKEFPFNLPLNALPNSHELNSMLEYLS